jgi:hypothetical protein
VYLARLKDIRAYLSDISMRLPHYQDLSWRLDVEVRGVRALVVAWR